MSPIPIRLRNAVMRIKISALLGGFDTVIGEYILHLNVWIIGFRFVTIVP